MYASAWGGDGGIRLYRFVDGPGPGTAPRGKIHGFSRASRRRLIDTLMAVPWSEIATVDKHATTTHGVFLTLTYPAEYPGEWETWKRHLDAFRRALAHRKPEGFGAIWRMEYQRRGAPHFHILLVFNEAIRITALRDWALGTWSRIVDSGDGRHARYGVDVRPVYKKQGQEARLLVYLVKYLGKPDDGERFGGRIWGGWYEVPCELRVAVTFRSKEGYVEFLRRVRVWGKGSRYLSKIANVTGLRLFGDGGRILAQLCRGLPDTTVHSL